MANTETAIEAMKLGAYDYISKPFNIDEIRLIVRKAIEKKKESEELALLRAKSRDDIFSRKYYWAKPEDAGNVQAHPEDSSEQLKCPDNR